MILSISAAVTTVLLSVGTFASIVAGLFTWKTRRQNKRFKEMEQLGQKLDLSVVAEDAVGLVPQLKQFDLFQRERSKWFKNGGATNILRGQVEGTSVYLFDYSYIVSTGKSAHKVTQTVFFADDKNWSLPDFKMKPETWWHKVLRKIGWEEDINFSESPDFSNKFWLTSEIEALVREKFTPALQDFLTERPPVHLEGSNYYLVAYKPGKTLTPTEARTFFEHCCQLVALLKKDGKAELLDLAEWRKETLKRKELD